MAAGVGGLVSMAVGQKGGWWLVSFPNLSWFISQLQSNWRRDGHWLCKIVIFLTLRWVQSLRRLTYLINMELSAHEAWSSVVFPNDSQLACFSLPALQPTDTSVGGLPKSTYLQECWHDIIRKFSWKKCSWAHISWWHDKVKIIK